MIPIRFACFACRPTGCGIEPEIAKGSPSVSDYALVRRQFHIFERALKKFKGDVGLWIQYIQVAKKEGARALVGRITARQVSHLANFLMCRFRT